MVLIVSARSACGFGAEMERGAAPWWDDFPTLVQTGDTAQAKRCHATAALCGAADDPTWGLYGQRVRLASSAKRIEELHAAGIKALTWIEAFGTASSYVVQLRRNPDGSWTKQPEDPGLTCVFRNHWGWQDYDGTGEIRWVGAHNYYDNDDFAAPYTRTHPRYGAPPMTYPDGRVATGYDGPATEPRHSRIYDAGCAKDVLGRVTFEYGFNKAVNQIQPETGLPRGPLTGLLNAGDAPVSVPDPGFTPEEWARLKRQRYAGLVSPGKDSACPMWIDYVRASIRQALDAGMDGLWVDNFSPWDSFNANPNLKAFGEWSVASFRGYLRERFSEPTLKAMGVADPRQFDIRRYLQARCKDWGGDPAQVRDSRWRDPRWQDDPVWRAYLIHKRQTGAAALSRFYRAIKEEAAAAGKPDFLVSGNDIPIFSLGWVRGDLDMVSTELSWGWGLTTGPRGLMPPPLGSYVPVYKLAREHARSRFVNLWMYVPDAQKDKPNIANVLYYQGLANHAVPMPHYPGRTASNEATDAAFFAFMRSVAVVFGDRTPIEEVGLYYSSSSQLIEMLPGGFRDHANQPHSFSFWGWGTALTWLHVQWRAVPEWKLTTETLKSLRVLVIPNAEVFPSGDAAVLERWVGDGGRLIIAGDCGRRLGESDNFERCGSGSTLSPLLAPEGAARPRVIALREDPGLPFYKADKQRPEQLAGFAKALEAAGQDAGDLSLAAPGVPWKVGLTSYQDKDRLFVDVNNTDMDVATDTVTPAPPVSFTVALPASLRGKPLQARTLSPDAAPAVTLKVLGNERAEVDLGSTPVYASVVIEARK